MRGDLDEARRRRLEVLDFYGGRPDDPFVARRPRLLAGEARRPRRRPRRRPSGTTGPRPRASPRSTDRSCSRCRLGMVADFDERAGDYAAAIEDAGGGDRDQRRARAPGLHRVAARPPRMGAAPRRRRRRAPRRCTSERSTAARRLQQHAGAVPRPRPGWPSLHRLHGRNDAAAAAGDRGARALPWPAGPAGSGTASTREPTCWPAPRRAARCSASSPPRPATGSERPACSATPTACAATPTRRSRRSSATTSTGPERRRWPLLGEDALPGRVRARPARRARPRAWP